MKTKNIIVGIIILFLSGNLIAQITVQDNGNILALTSDFFEENIKAEGKITIRSSDNIGLHISRTGINSTTNDSYIRGIYSGAPVERGKTNVGIYGSSIASSPLNSGRAMGVMGAVTNSTSGYNYGVVGILYGQQYGTGVYGGFDIPQYISGRYAGYFSGNVKVTETVTAGVFTTLSDSRYKQNIVQLENEEGKTLKNILDLNPVKYNLKHVALRQTFSDTSTVVMTRELFNKDSQQLKKEHFGLIAQEVQNIYPNLVYEDSDGYLSINYIGLIPLLIEAIKEQQEQIDELKQQQLSTPPSKKNAIVDTSSNIVQSEVVSNNILHQNAPNPFSTSTEIKYFLEENVHKANLYIYDMQGRQIKNIANLLCGDNSIMISSYELTPGMYIYTLVADGKEVDTKRMILTD